MRIPSLFLALLLSACPESPDGDVAQPDDDDASTAAGDDDDAAPDDDDSAADDDDSAAPDDDDDDAADDDDSAAPDDDDVDCSALEASSSAWHLCGAWPDRCEATYDDGAGCTAVCAAAGLTCTGAWEDRDDACAPDLDRAPLPCDSGHQSDFCVCGGDGVPLTADPGPPPLDPFDQLLAEREGFGAAAVGGDPNNLYVVTTLDDDGPGSLRAALESTDSLWIQFAVDGTIVWQDDTRVESHKTVDGRGRSVVVDGTWRIESASEVVISDLELTRSLRSGESPCEQDGDVVLIRGYGGASPSDFDTHTIWLNHLWLHDGGDGLVDIRGGTNITLSANRFSSHKKVTLAWDDRAGDPTPGMQVTWTRNHFDQTSVRNPRFNYGLAHLYNNVWTQWWQYGVASYNGAQIRSESNVYDAASDCVGIPNVLPCDDPNPCGDDGDWFVDRSVALTTEGEGNAPGDALSVGDWLVGGAQVDQRNGGSVFTPPYPYVALPADAALQAAVIADAGPRTGWTPGGP